MKLDLRRIFSAFVTFSERRGLLAGLVAVTLGLGLALGQIVPDAGAQDRNQGQKAEKKRGGGKDAAGRKRGGKGGRRGRRGRGGPSRVEVDEVKIVPVVQTVPVLGRMVPRQSGVVAARISGPVARMNVHVGDRVKKGDVLAILVQDTLRWQRELKAAEVVEYEGVVASSRARLAKTQNELRRIQRLSRSAAFSQARFEDQQHVVATSQGELKKAEAELRQARANYNMAAINLKYSEVRAPYPGVVIQRHTDAGAYLGVGGPVVTLLNDAELEIEVDAPSSRLGGLTAGAVIAVEFEDKKSRQATVRAVIPDENPLARTRAVRLTPSDAMRRVNAAANQSVLVRIPVGAKRNALSVHKDAKLQRSGNSVVFVVKGGRAELRRVRLGTAIGGRFEVLGGLTAGEFVVVRGNERLSDGKRVRLKGNGE